MNSPGWSYRRYLPEHLRDRLAQPCISRIVPSGDGFYFEISDPGYEGGYILSLGPAAGGERRKIPFEGKSFAVGGLEKETDFSFCVARACGTGSSGAAVTGSRFAASLAASEGLAFFPGADPADVSSLRRVRCCRAPGVTVDYLHPADTEYSFSGRYLCSPSLLKLPGGGLLASLDLYAPGGPQNLSAVYRSDDGGESWHRLCELFPCFWGKLFLSGGKLFMLACSTEYGDLLIGRSDDGGSTWTAPSVIARGACDPGHAGWHRAPMPVTENEGLIMTDVQWGSWKEKFFLDGILSAPADADLLDPSVWSISPLRHSSDFVPGLPESVRGGIEGSVVIRPDGGACDFLRLADGSALMLDISTEKGSLSFSGGRAIPFPSTASKADVIRDPVSCCYLSAVSYLLEEPKTRRNLLSLIASEDLENWRLLCHIIDMRDADPAFFGFQYADFIIDGNDILLLSRTAFSHAHSFHDSNFITFHRIKNFRKML